MTQPFAPQFYPAPTVPVGIGPPNAIYQPIAQAVVPSYVPALDFTLVTGVTLHVARPDGTTAQWVATALLQVTTTGLVAKYAFQVADCPTDGSYAIRPYLSVTGFPNAIPCSSSTLLVVFR
jgi:hypothetical protein